MEGKLDVVRVQEGIERFGRFIGWPVLTVCFSDKGDGSAMSVTELCKSIEAYGYGDVVFTGCEPLRQLPAITELCDFFMQQIRTKQLRLHLQSTGSLVTGAKDLDFLSYRFYYLCFFPSTLEVAQMLHLQLVGSWYRYPCRSDIIVTTKLDGKVGDDMLPYATMVRAADDSCLRKVEEYCINQKVKMAMRWYDDRTK